MNDGLISVRSPHSYKATLSRFHTVVEQAGLTIFAEIDHSANASAVDLPLRPTALLLLGNPRGGAPLMQINQAVALDLPFRAVVWKDDEGIAWITYNDPHWLAGRYRLGPAAEPAWSAISDGMKKLAGVATA
jgi:uncharacterized protein (DUF302 family)